jgi:pimeloyl-ACP methyl ester carboxylesterase
MKEAVILVHGIWMNGAEMWRLRQRLQQAGYECHQFKYPCLKKTPEENADALHRFVSDIDAKVLHFVCFSLGGVVLLHLFDQYLIKRPGRIVFLGAPVNGSEVAQRLYRSRLTRWSLGKSVHRGLLGDRPVWMKWRDIGIIAGTIPLGVGLIVGGLRMPHDGTVSVDETCLGGATDSITYPASHLGLLYSQQVAMQVMTFLRAGKFGDEATNLLFDASG